MVLTPTYHAFRMHVPFQDSVSLPVQLRNNPQYIWGSASIPAVSASAARGKDGKLHLSLVNTNPKEAMAVSVTVPGSVPKAAKGSLLSARAMDAHNSFAAPNMVVPVPFHASHSQGRLRIELPPKSVAVVAVEE